MMFSSFRYFRLPQPPFSPGALSVGRGNIFSLRTILLALPGYWFVGSTGECSLSQRRTLPSKRVSVLFHRMIWEAGCLELPLRLGLLLGKSNVYVKLKKQHLNLNVQKVCF